MPPIRIGFIGLSSKPDCWATLAHIPYLRRSPHYEIVALCNSTPAKALESIAAHNLPPTTKAYASPGELAADASIDLIVICTRVDIHYTVALPTLLAGKAIFIEWPLAATTAQAGELLSLAQTQNVRTIIGLQARVSPTLLKIREIVSSGRLGTIHSVNVQATSGVWQHDIASVRYEHFLKRDVGGNLLTIYGIHILDAVFASVGELVPGSYSCAMGNLRPRMLVPEQSPSPSSPSSSSSPPPSEPVSEKLEQVDKDTPDQILLIGRLDRGHASPPAMLSFHLRAGSRAKDTPGATWRIYGEAAELVVEFASAGPQIGQAKRIEIHHFAPAAAASAALAAKAAQEVEDVCIDEGGDDWTGLPVPGQNIGRLYEAFATGREVPGWDVAMRRHGLIDEFWTSGGM
jgi:predicted dehydrogenase